MTLTEARALRDDIRAAGLACSVPLGHGPAGYWVELSVRRHARTRLRSREEWLAWRIGFLQARWRALAEKIRKENGHG